MSVSGPAPPIFVAKASVEARAGTVMRWGYPLVGLAVGWAVTLLAFRQTVASILRIWSGSSTYSYGFIIMPVCALLIWRRKEDLEGLSPTGSVVGLAVFFLSTLLWVAGNVADAQLIQHVALVAMLDSLAWAFLGSAVVKTLRFPMLFLFLAVPVGDSLVPILQRWTATFTVSALRLSGIPAFQDGVILSTPSGNWQVAEACSGIRYLLASIVIGVLVAGVAYRSWKRRILFLLLSIFLPVVANAIRAYGIVVLAYVSGNSIATGVDHVLYGFVFFSLLTACLMMVAIRWYEPLPGAAVPSEQPPASQAGFVTGSMTVAATLLAVVAIAFSATTVTGFLWSRSPVLPPASSFSAPQGWLPATELDHEWAPEPASMRSRTVRTFASGASRVSTFSGWYLSGLRGVELINSANVVGKSGAWTLLSSDTRRATVAGDSLVVSERVIARGNERRLVWLWYSIGGESTSNPYGVRVIEARARLFGHPQNTALYAVSAPYESDPAEASAILAGFLK